MSVKVAIIDSGINPNHIHVRGIEEGVGFYIGDKNRVIKTHYFTDIIGHGTAISGVIKKKAPFAKLYAVKIFNKELETSVSVLIAALNWAINKQANIINLSLGTNLLKYKEPLKQICDTAYKKNIFIVSSAKTPYDITFPAAIDTTIGVCQNPNCDEDTIVHYPENLIEFGACGQPLPIPGLRQKLNFSGSSFAAAHISGIIALKIKNNREADISGIKKELAAQSIKRVGVKFCD